MCLDIPELADNKEFLDCIQLHYKSYNLFEELMEMELMQKRVEFIQSMKDGLVDMDKEGNEIKFWSSEFLVKKYLHLSEADLATNKKLKDEETERLNLAGNESNDEGDDAGWESLNDDDKNILLEMLKNKKEELKEEIDKKKKRKKKPCADTCAEEE